MWSGGRGQGGGLPWGTEVKGDPKVQDKCFENIKVHGEQNIKCVPNARVPPCTVPLPHSPYPTPGLDGQWDCIYSDSSRHKGRR